MPRTQRMCIKPSRHPMQMERDRAAELTQGAQEDFSQLRNTYDARKAEADPHRARRKELRETAARTSEKFKCAQDHTYVVIDRLILG